MWTNVLPVHLGVMGNPAWNFMGSLFVATLLTVPGALLLARFVGKPRIPWWLIVFLSVLMGWGSTIGASFCKTKALSTEIKAYEARGEQIPEALLETWASDAHAMGALFLGWALASCILCPWILLYGLTQGLRNAYRKSKERAP
ncbi:MAG: hypothetical protein P8L18_16925 [Verrucomicrobiota bacterium]|nr:hypothetical protein [Verrucomicrobiota bacterium]